MSDEVLITGLGAVSCLGAGIDTLWRGMSAGRSDPARVDDPHAHMERPLLYSVPADAVAVGPVENDGYPPGRGARYAIAAACQAVRDAALGAVEPSRVAVVIGTGMGDAGLHERRRAERLTSARPGDVEGWDPEPWSPWSRPPRSQGVQGWQPAFSVASEVGGWFGAAGANMSVSNACAASGFALSMAADLIRSGEADVVIAGGAEAYSRVAMGCFNRMGAVDPRRCRPFDRDRKGTMIGEGAGVLVLESDDHARGRSAPQIYAKLSGAGWSCDAHHVTAPEPSGAQIVRAMRKALTDAGIAPDDLGCVVPHGTGTELNDVVESRALGEVLGSATDRVPLYSLKALIGHTAGAACALAVVAAALIVHRRWIPGNVPLGEQDPACAVDLPDGDTPFKRRCALVNAYAFGGNNISLVIEEVGP